MRINQETWLTLEKLYLFCFSADIQDFYILTHLQSNSKNTFLLYFLYTTKLWILSETEPPSFFSYSLNRNKTPLESIINSYKARGTNKRVFEWFPYNLQGWKKEISPSISCCDYNDGALFSHTESALVNMLAFERSIYFQF